VSASTVIMRVGSRAQVSPDLGSRERVVRQDA
jgi:hypothetical protein